MINLTKGMEVAFNYITKSGEHRFYTGTVDALLSNGGTVVINTGTGFRSLNIQGIEQGPTK